MPEADNANITTYQYDLQGSLLKEESADFCKQYFYNDFHQCIQTDVIRGREESAERLVQENLYDGEGLRFAIIENGKRTGFITDGWNNLTEIDGNGRVTKRIIRGMGIVASEDTEQKEDNIFTTAYHYYHGNERMDVEFITDEAGNVVNNYTYDAFGGIISSNETIPNRYTYNGEAFDKITEQYYLRKRYYNPKLCRFTQEDEYRGDGLNLYAFCANNPVMYIDPSGYKCETGAEADRDADESATGGNIQASQNDVDEAVQSGSESGSTSVYIPMDADGNPIPLNKQRINGQDIPLPDPEAQGRPHTVLGGKVSSETGEVYRQSATFSGGSWPTANGYEVPLSEVHWTNHGRADVHTNPHQHVFNYDFENRYWYRSDPEIF